MNFTDAVRESMARFLKGRLNLSEIAETQGGEVKYTPDYFDDLEAALEDMPEEDEADESNT
jgi:hypothetical protein